MSNEQQPVISAAIVAAIIADATAADGMPAAWQSGCDSAREYIARHIADSISAPLNRAEFFAACNTTDI